jgi:hypothetical protein
LRNFEHGGSGGVAIEKPHLKICTLCLELLYDGGWTFITLENSTSSLGVKRDVVVSSNNNLVLEVQPFHKRCKLVNFLDCTVIGKITSYTLNE